MSDRIQEGVFFRPGERPPMHFSIIFLRSGTAVTPIQVKAHLDQLWQMLQALKSGVVQDLPGQTIDPKSLAVLVGYGRRFFRSLNLTRRMPPELKGFRPPRENGGGRVTLASGLSYEPVIFDNKADADIALQFTGRSALVVRRAAVETWKAVADSNDSEGVDVLTVSTSYTGFGREDGRSWIDFFDGTSNLRSDQRLQVIEVKQRDQSHADSWKEQGTYLCYMRLAVGLADWRRLTRAQQEALVGRDKLTGCGLEPGPDGKLHPVTGCPVTAGGNVRDGTNDHFREAPRPVSDPVLAQSHIHRASHGRENLGDPESRRVYRQGYEFFDGFLNDGTPDLGLNFVSFQDDPQRIVSMLKLQHWLGATNFGGDDNNPLPGIDNLLRVRAAGFFVVPPKRDDGNLPGTDIFEEVAVG